jgi:hypothetical protein
VHGVATNVTIANARDGGDDPIDRCYVKAKKFIRLYLWDFNVILYPTVIALMFRYEPNKNPKATKKMGYEAYLN